MVQKLTKEQGIIITGYTGIICAYLKDFHLECEKRLGRPILLHEFLYLKQEIKALFKEDFMNMMPTEEKDENK